MPCYLISCSRSWFVAAKVSPFSSPNSHPLPFQAMSQTKYNLPPSRSPTIVTNFWPLLPDQCYQPQPTTLLLQQPPYLLHIQETKLNTISTLKSFSNILTSTFHKDQPHVLRVASSIASITSPSPAKSFITITNSHSGLNAS